MTTGSEPPFPTSGRPGGASEGRDGEDSATNGPDSGDTGAAPYASQPPQAWPPPVPPAASGQQPPVAGAPGQPWPPPTPPGPEQPQQHPHYGYQQNVWQQQPAPYGQQAPGQPTPGQPPPPGHAPPGQPAPGAYPYGYYQQPVYASPGGYYYYGQPAGPGNDIAVASAVTGGCAIGALIFTVGVAAPLSLIASIVAVVLGVKGKKAVDSGKTRKHRDVAQAGFWMGIVGIVLSVIATAVLVAVIVIGVNASEPATDPGDLAALLELLDLLGL